MRKKLKKLSLKEKNKDVSYRDIETMGNFYKLMSKQQRNLY